MEARCAPRCLLVGAWLVAAACGEPSPPADSDDVPCLNKCDDDLRSFPLPATIDLGADPSAVAVRDLDDDGYLDLALLVRDPDRTGADNLALVVAYGDGGATWTSRFRHTLTGSVVLPTRDSSSSVVAVFDIDRDGELDLATASGIAFGLGGRDFDWTSFGDVAEGALQPVAVVRVSSQTFVVRGTWSGQVERCNADGTCAALDGQKPACDSTLAYCPIEDLVIADITGDGRRELIAGRPTDVAGTPDRIDIWKLSDSWPHVATVEDVSAVDFEIGDIDRDGRADLVAQRRETVSDFPSHTDLWFGTDDPAAPLVREQTIYNHDNHTDNAALADVDGDGCLDYAVIGVDKATVGLRYGAATATKCSRHVGMHDPSKPADIGWMTVPAPSGMIGIQQLDANGDGVDDWLIRAPLYDGGPAVLHFLALP